MQIRISYKVDRELNEVIELLKPRIKSIKVAKTYKGPYKKAYIEFK